MFVVGGVCLIGYGFWEAYGAKFPSAPGRILKNRTVITAIIIDVIYLLAGCELRSSSVPLVARTAPLISA